MNQLTTRDLLDGYHNPEFAGFGYYGAREIANEKNPALVAEVDQFVLDVANRRGLTANQLFEWANSRVGRWFADDMLTSAPYQYRVNRATKHGLLPGLV